MPKNVKQTTIENGKQRRSTWPLIKFDKTPRRYLAEEEDIEVAAACCRDERPQQASGTECEGEHSSRHHRSLLSALSATAMVCIWVFGVSSSSSSEGSHFFGWSRNADASGLSSSSLWLTFHHIGEQQQQHQHNDSSLYSSQSTTTIAQTQQQQQQSLRETQQPSHQHQNVPPMNHQDQDLQQCLTAPSKSGSSQHGGEIAEMSHDELWSELMDELQQEQQQDPQEESPYSLWILLQQEQHQDLFVDSSSSLERMQSVVNTMFAYQDHPIVQREACWLLAKLAATSAVTVSEDTAGSVKEDYHVSITSAGGIPAILAAMQNHASAPLVQEQACAALRNLALFDENEDSIVNAGGVTMLLQAMQRHDHVVRVQEQGIGALRNLAGKQAHKEAIVAMGLETVLQAMEQFSHVPNIVEQACATLRNLAWNKPNRVKVASSGGIAIIVHAMQGNTQHAGIQEQACAALATLGHLIQNRITIAKGHGIGAILMAMQQHPQHAQIQTQASAALDVLAFHNRDNQVAIIRSGGPELVLQALKQHGTESLSVATVGCELLTRLMESGGDRIIAQTEGLEDWLSPERTKERGEILQTIRSKHPTAMGVQQSCKIP